MSEITLSDGRGGRFPNPRAFDFKWKEEQALLEELDKLHGLLQVAGREHLATKELIRKLENEHARGRVAALRGAEQPDEKPLEQAKAKEEQLLRQIKDLRQAVEMVRGDLFKVVQTNRDELLPQVEERIAKAREELEAVEMELHRKQHALEASAKLKEWLDSPELGYGLSPAPQAV